MIQNRRGQPRCAECVGRVAPDQSPGTAGVRPQNPTWNRVRKAFSSWPIRRFVVDFDPGARSNSVWTRSKDMRIVLLRYQFALRPYEVASSALAAGSAKVGNAP